MKIFHDIRIFFLIAVLLLVSNLLYAQSGSIDGDNDGVPFSISWKLLEGSKGVSFSGKTINITSENNASFSLNFGIAESGGKIIKVKVPSGRTYTTNTSERSPTIPTKIKITIKPTYLSTLKSSETRELIVFVQDANKNQLSMTTFPIRFSPPVVAPVRSASDCKGKFFQAKIDCLEKLLPELSGSEKSIANSEILSLNTEKDKAIKALRGFKVVKLKGDGNYSVRCKNCSKFDFKINKITKSAKNNRWSFSLKSTRKHKVTIKSKSWPALTPYTYALNYTARNKDLAQDSEIKEEADQVDEPDQSEEESISPEDTITALDQNLARQDSINQAKSDSLEMAILEDGTLDYVEMAKNYWYLALIPLILFILFFRGKKSKAPALKDSHTDIGTKAVSVDHDQISNSESNHEKPSHIPQNTEDEHEPEPEALEDFEIDIKEVEESNSIAPEDAVHIAKTPLYQIEDHVNYHKVVLQDVCWENTAVRNIYLSFGSVEGIDHRVRDANLKYVPADADSGTEELPETGGFLLGHVYELEEDNHFDVSFEVFVPITAESQDRYTVKFGDIAWSELDDSLKKYPGLTLVGWFHTHPGHGLFLSEADINEHKALFQKPYQIAMEIDPLTRGFDAAFFTWQQSGEKDLNNIDQRVMDKWWSFRLIENQIWEKRAKK